MARTDFGDDFNDAVDALKGCAAIISRYECADDAGADPWDSQAIRVIGDTMRKAVRYLETMGETE